MAPPARSEALQAEDAELEAAFTLLESGNIQEAIKKAVRKFGPFVHSALAMTLDHCIDEGK